MEDGDMILNATYGGNGKFVVFGQGGGIAARHHFKSQTAANVASMKDEIEKGSVVTIEVDFEIGACPFCGQTCRVTGVGRIGCTRCVYACPVESTFMTMVLMHNKVSNAVAVARRVTQKLTEARDSAAQAEIRLRREGKHHGAERMSARAGECEELAKSLKIKLPPLPEESH